MIKFLKKLINTIANLLLIIIIFIAIFLFYTSCQTKLKKQEYPNVFGYTFFKVVTGSMANTINIDDLVIVEIKKTETEFKENDIVVYKQENNMITHRIVKIEEDKIITKGDANNTLDEPIIREQIVGKVIKIVPNVGIWQKVLGTPQVFFSIIITIILFGLAFSGDKNKKEDNDD